MCCPKSVTTSAVVAAAVTVQWLPRRLQWQLPAYSHDSRCHRHHTQAVASTTVFLPLMGLIGTSPATSRCRSFSPPQAQSHLTPSPATAHHHPHGNDASWDQPRPELGGFTGKGRMIVSLLPAEAAGRGLSMTPTWGLKESASLRVNTLEPGVSPLCVFQELRAICNSSKHRKQLRQ